jgi:hypothetical protein
MSIKLPHQPLPLNKSQRRHLAATLDRVDRTFADLEALPSLTPTPRLLRPQRMDVPADRVGHLAEFASGARRMLAEGIDALELPVDEDSAHRRLSAQLSTSLVLLYDAGSRGMRAYGPVHPDIELYLDPWLADLRERVKALLALIHDGVKPGFDA